MGLVGERFFASGNERTVVELPEGYGYKVDFWDQWNLVYDLMNMGPDPITVYVELEVTYKSSFANVDPVRPVWLDIDQCGDSECSIPAGPSDDTWDWNVNRPGDIVAIGGHVHDEGVWIEAVNQTTGQSICDSVAGYGVSRQPERRRQQRGRVHGTIRLRRAAKANEGNKMPTVATAAPASPSICQPMNVAVVTTGPGVTGPTATASSRATWAAGPPKPITPSLGNSPASSARRPRVPSPAPPQSSTARTRLVHTSAGVAGASATASSRDPTRWSQARRPGRGRV